MLAHPAHAIDHPSVHFAQGLDTQVEGALWAFGPLRSTGSVIGITTDDAGRVVLEGSVISDSLRDVATAIARAVPGVTHVDNRLVSDATLASQVADALLEAAAVRLLTDRLDVLTRLGTVYIGGTYHTPDRAAAEQALAAALDRVRALTGVRHVIEDFNIVEGAAGVAAGAGDGETRPAASGPDPAFQERLRVWRERAGAR